MNDAFSLTSYQRQIWSLFERIGPHPSLHQTAAMVLPNDAIVADVTRVLAEFQQQHAILRTRVRRDGPRVLQWVAKTSEVALQSRLYHRDELRRCCQLERGQRMNPAGRALVVWRLLELHDEQRLLLMVSIHRLIADATSMGILRREVCRRFEGALPRDAKPQTLDYAEFAALHHRWLSTGEGRRQRRYWLQQAAATPTRLRLPFDDERRRSVPAPAGLDQQSWSLSSRSQERLLSEYGTSDERLEVVFLAAYALLLSRWCGQVRVPITVRAENRRMEGVQSTIGCFDSLPIVNLTVPASGADVQRGAILDLVREALREARAHADVVIGELMELEGEGAGEAVLPSYLGAAMYFTSPTDLGAEAAEANHGEVELEALVSAVPVYAPHKLLFCVEVRDAQTPIRLSLHYDRACMSANSVERMQRGLERIVDALVQARHPTLPPLHTMTVEDDERTRQLVEWNATDLPRKPERLVSLLLAQPAAESDRLALVQGEERLTYEELWAATEHVADQLRALGIGPGHVIGMGLPRSPASVITMLSILRIGAVYLPLSLRLPPDRLRFLVEDAMCAMVITSTDAMEIFAGVACAVFEGASHEPLRQLNDRAIGEAVDELQAQPLGCYLLYTSGTTGNPKGVLGSERALVNRLCWMRETYPAGVGEVFLHKACISFVDHIAEILQPLLEGATLVLAPAAADGNLRVMASCIEQFQVSRITAVPNVLKHLLAVASARSLESLRLIFSSGDTLTRALGLAIAEALPTTRLVNVYGSTEVGADVSWHEVSPSELVDAASHFAGETWPTNALGPSTSQAYPQITEPDIPLEALSAGFLDTQMPEHPQLPAEYFAYLEGSVLPYLVNVTSELFIGHMTAGLPEFLGEVSRLVTQLNQNMVKIETSKVLTLLERQVLAILHREFFNATDSDYPERLGDPEHVFGVVTSGGSSANITALWCARNRALINRGADKATLVKLGAHATLGRHGFERAVIIASPLAHYSMKKAAALLGLGEDDILVLEQTPERKACLRDLEVKLEACASEGALVIAIIGIAGATETGTIDPLDAMAEVAQRHGVHFHVDAAWGGGFIFSPTYRELLNGIERADSITFCAHKQMFTPLGVSMVLYRDTQLAHVSSVHAVYQAKRGSFDAGQYSLEGSRPATCLMMHAVLRMLSRSGLAWLVDSSMERTQALRALIHANEAFELIGEPELNIINYRYLPASLRGRDPATLTLEENDEISRHVAELQQQQFTEGRSFVSKTEIALLNYPGKRMTVFRVVLANPRTGVEELRAVLDDQLRVAVRCFGEQETLTASTASSSVSVEVGTQAGAFEAHSGGHHRVPIGRPISNLRLYILDAEGAPLPLGVIGEICVAGEGLALGYWRRTQLNERAFVSNPHRADETLFRTGDLGRYREDGAIEFLGRGDQQVKINGVRVELSETESRVCHIEGVQQCVVVVQEHPSRGKRLVGFVVFDPTAGPRAIRTGVQLRQYLLRRLPSESVPERFVLLDALPLTPSGKSDRKVLEAMSAHAAYA